MKALRWILFCLVAFGAGTGVAFAMHPPTVGIPKSDAADLATDLSKIRSYAAAGKCSAVRGRLNSASATIANLPVNTNASIERQLSAELEKVRTAALDQCEQVAVSNLPEVAASTPETTPTTPTPTPEPTPESNPTPTPDAGSGGDQTTPDSNSGGTTTDGDTPTPDDGGGPQDGQGDNSGGITLPNGVEVPGPGQVQRKIDRARDKIEKALGR